MCREMDKLKEKIRSEHPCPHPSSCVVTGRNQYGEWDRCLRCKTKISYRPHSSKMEKKSKDKGKDVIYVPTAAPFEPKRLARAKAYPIEDALSSTDVTSERLQLTLLETNQQMLAGMTTVLSQAISPLMTGQQALIEMTQQSMNNQTLMMQTMQQSQGAMAQAMTEMSQQMRREQDEEEWEQMPHAPGDFH